MDRTVNPSTCAVCMAIFMSGDAYSTVHSNRELLTWKKSRAELEKSVAAGCPLCTAFSTRYHKDIYVSDTPGAQPVHEIGFKLNLMGNIDVLAVLANAPFRSGNFLSFQLLTTGDDPAAKHIPQRQPGPDVSSPQAFERAKLWIDVCNESHGDTCMKLGLSKMPTRVIDVSPVDNPESAKLFISNGAVAPYAALSYCWGMASYKTTTDNFDFHVLHEVPMDLLPRTIQDAIHVTRRLGIRYLWVDSLCIVQDSAKDMTTELSRMEDIYRNSYVTISAALAQDARHGFLDNRALTSIIPGEAPIYLPYKTATGEIGTVGLFKKSETKLVRDPIHSRAWTMQEHLLAPRMIVYGSLQMFWVCRATVLQCGDQISLGNKVRRKNWETMHQNLSPGTVQATARSQGSVALTSLWASIFDEMSKRKAYDPVHRLITNLVLARITGEILKYPSGTFTEDMAMPLADIIKDVAEKWKQQHSHLRHDKVKAASAILKTWNLVQAPSAQNPMIVSETAYLWKDVVEEYSSRKLSNHADKLNASAAIVASFSKLTDDQYVLGHWRRDLLPQLTWVSSTPQTSTRPVVGSNLGCPSWSWLSLDGPVEIWPRLLENPAKTPVAEVVNFTVSPLHPILPYGPIKSSTLKIRGYLKPIILDYNSRTARPQVMLGYGSKPVDVFLDSIPANGQFQRATRSTFCMALVKWVSIFEWGLGNNNTAQAVGGIVVDVSNGEATRIGSFSGGRTCPEDGNVQYGNVNEFDRGFGWLTLGYKTTISLV